jgi:hypothetical protein
MVGSRRSVLYGVLACVGVVASCGGQSFNEADAGGAGTTSAGAGATTAGSAGRGGSGSGGISTGSGGISTGSGGISTGSGGISVGSGGNNNAGCPAAGPAERIGGCPDVVCPDGIIIQGCGCPYCTCDGVGCPAVDCPADMVMVREPGACCDTCVPAASSCESVVCQDPGPCDANFSLKRLPGACCASCVPNDDQPVGCLEIACPETLECPLGYTAGGGDNGGCCYECVPDRLFCMSHDDCLLASKRHPSSCCACPQVISQRLYDEDPCWFGAFDGRPEPAECAPECDSNLACPCAHPGERYCEDHQCVSAFVPPPN